MVSGWVLTGAVFGFTTQMFTNGLRKMPLTRYPWEYAIFTLGGAAGGYYLDGEMQNATKRLAEIKAKRVDLAKGPPREVLDNR